MKHSLFVKALAILLCALSLIGILGGAAGALILVEGDLYNKTVDEVIVQRVEELTTASANQIASRYADQVLGGTPDEISRSFGNDVLSRYFSAYGYTILDAEGNVLLNLNPERKTEANTHAIPVTGQYMHLVSLETDTEKLARETADRMESIGRVLEDQNGQTVPMEGVLVNQVFFTDEMGTPIYEAYGDAASCHSIFYYNDEGNVRGSSQYDHENRNQIGFLYYGTDGRLMYRSFLEELDHNFTAAEVFGVMFLSHDAEFLFQTEKQESLGMLQFENGHLLFTGIPAPQEAPEETQPAETVPETTAETLPPETTEVTRPEEETEAAQEEAESEEDEDSDEKKSEEKKSEEKKSEKEDSEDEDDRESSSASAVPEEEDSEAETTPPQTLPPETLPPETVPAETVSAEETLPPEDEPILINGKPLEYYQVNRAEFIDHATGEHTTAKYVYLPMPELTVEIYADRNDLRDTAIYNVLQLLRQYRSFLLPVIGGCLLLFILCTVYLFTAAGRSAKTEEVRAGGMNRIPLDLHLILGIAAGTGLAGLAVTGTPVLLRSDFTLGCSLAAASAFLCSLIFVDFCYACMAQAKTPAGYWWRNLLCIRLVFLSMRFMQWLAAWLQDTFFPWLKRVLKTVWAKTWKALVWLYGAIEKMTAKAGRMLNHFFSLIPLTWQWVVCGIVLLCLLLTVQISSSDFLSLLCLVASFAMILYGSHCFGLLLATARKMGKGDLDTKIESKLLVGSFRNFADDLNDLADAATEAAQKQLKSERMKTELITNVSHDIKTPLTSIINYVDLLQKPHTDEENAQYLEVLDRQSQRLKKLVDDLMDMSKASTGNMAVEITRVDAVESINQALGEFSDKLERAWLYPVFRHSEASVPMMADGKLVWRVLNNLLGNIVKYGMPGTRIYLDLTHMNGKVVISLKNISREELNVTPEELMERFVRGDVSRNTEGSGLGLNIAKSLMELQGGSLQLLVDGDLFKVTLIFPDAK